MDILLDDNLDLAIVSGDIAQGSTFLQEQRLLMETSKNDWKEYPDVGIGAESYLEDEDPHALYAEIREQYVKCGMEVKSISNKNGTLIVIRK